MCVGHYYGLALLSFLVILAFQLHWLFATVFLAFGLRVRLFQKNEEKLKILLSFYFAWDAVFPPQRDWS